MSKIFIADKPTLDTVNANVGSEANAASATGSVHAKIKDIRGITGINGQASGTTTVMGALRRIWELLGISGQASGTTTVMGYLRRIDEAGGVRVVRSNQTGFVSMIGTSGSGEDGRFTDVTIAAVTVNNCMVYFQTQIARQQSSSVLPSSARLISATQVRISHASSAVGFLHGRWHVIEYF